jgi:Trypsin
LRHALLTPATWVITSLQTMVRRVLIPLIAGFSLVSATAQAAITLQPGIRIESKGAQCTSNFLYDGTGSANRGKVYLGTAAHCVSKIGDAVSDDGGEDFGRVAFIGDGDTLSKDFAFIEVLPAFTSRVSAAVKGHPQLPRAGAARPDQTSPGDPVQVSGFGLIFGLLPATEEQRTATLVEHETLRHRVLGPLMQGDSGGPLVHLPSARALGVVSSLCIGTCVGIEGPTVQGILSQAASAGFPVALRTVDAVETAMPPAVPVAAARRTLASRVAIVARRRVRLSAVAIGAATRLELARPAGGRWRTLSRRAVRGFAAADSLVGFSVRSGSRRGVLRLRWRKASGRTTSRTYRFTSTRLL